MSTRSIPSSEAIAPHAGATLAVLSIGNFVVGIAAFVVLGLMTTVTRSLGLDPAEGARLMTAYAIAYAIGSPLLIAATGRLQRRGLIIVSMLLIAVGAFGCALSPSLGGMEVARVVGALGAGLFTPAASAIAVSLYRPERRGWALSQVFMGFTAAQGIGNPAGTWLGYTFGYQWTFLLVGGITLAMAVALARLVPKDVQFRPVSLADLGRTLARPHLLVGLLFTVFYVTSTYTTMTYLTYMLETRAHLDGTSISLVLAVYGAMAFVAAVAGSRLIDRIGPSRYLLAICLAMVVVLPLVTQGPTKPIALTVVLGAWSLLAWSHFAAQQTRLITMDPTRAPLLLALNASMLYVGIALGSICARLLLPVPDFTGIAIGGEALVVVALVVLLVGDRMARRVKSATATAKA